MFSQTQALDDIPEEFIDLHDPSLKFMEKDLKIKCFCERYYAIEYSLWNYGAGNALRVYLEYRADSITGKSGELFPLSKNEKRILILIFSKDLWSNGFIQQEITSKEKKVELSFSYSDVESRAEYRQKEIIRFHIDEQRMPPISSKHHMSSPEKITR